MYHPENLCISAGSRVHCQLYRSTISDRTIEVMGQFDGAQQRGFLKFVTGCPKLPVGGAVKNISLFFSNDLLRVLPVTVSHCHVTPSHTVTWHRHTVTWRHHTLSHDTVTLSRDVITHCHMTPSHCHVKLSHTFGWHRHTPSRGGERQKARLVWNLEKRPSWPWPFGLFHYNNPR